MKGSDENGLLFCTQLFSCSFWDGMHMVFSGQEDKKEKEKNAACPVFSTKLTWAQ